ncbi:MAG: HlyD family efflux transporter periplasmic adaptor subunit [Rhizobacter sp.]|nr:HlyD family efflux transporter periplasmic adaptor subunit [Rhizobacter sp.]
MKTKNKILMALPVALLTGLVVWAFMPTPQPVEAGTVRSGRFERVVQEDGKTRLRDRYVVSMPLAGRVQRLTLRQGDSVAQGDVIATVLPAEPALLDERTRLEQRERIGAAEATLQRAQSNIERAGAALAKAVADTRRTESLAQQGFVSPTQVESERLNQRLREKELETARREADAARHQLAQAQVALQPTRAPSGATTTAPWQVHAPLAAKVLKVAQQSEGVLPAGTPLVELGDPSQLEVVVDVLTEDAAQIRPGAPVRLNGWGGAPLAGVVRLVEPAAFTKVSALGVEEQRVNAVIDISSPRALWASLGDGFRMEVGITVQTLDPALMVPVSALFPQGDRSALFVLDGGRVHLRTVKLLARNGVDAAVDAAEGLPAGTRVVVYPPPTLKDGARVAVRE